MRAQRQLEEFKHELWKDQRRLETRETPNGLALVKHFTNDRERDTELHVLNWLASTQDVARVPALLGYPADSIELEYIQGIRVFNLLVELDRLPSHLRARGEAIKRTLLARADRNQGQMQAALRAIARLPHWCPYPAGTRILRIVQILAPSLDFGSDQGGLECELADLNSRWEPMAVVPFRDATTKNMVLAAPDLWLGAFDGEDARRDLIVHSLEECDRLTGLAPT